MIEDEVDYSNPKNAPLFYGKMRERNILRTKLDVTYSDFNNWEKRKILYVHSDAPKGKWKQLNYLEYIWVRIVDHLRKYGFGPDEIPKFRDILLMKMPKEQLILNADKKKDELKAFSEEAASYLDSKEVNELKEEEIDITFLDVLVYHTIISKKYTSLIFIRGRPNTFSVEFEAVYDELWEDKTKLKEFFSLNHKTQLRINLNDIISNLMTDKGEVEFGKKMILSEDEYTLISTIRKNKETLNSVEIRYDNGKPIMIEMTKYGTVEAESRLMDHIQKGEYAEIVIQSQKGKISSFKKKTRFKL